MNVYTLNGKQKNQIELSQKFDLSDEYFAIASNSLDKIAIGGDKQQIDVHVLNQEEQDGRFEENVMGEPSLAMKF